MLVRPPGGKEPKESRAWQLLYFASTPRFGTTTTSWPNSRFLLPSRIVISRTLLKVSAWVLWRWAQVSGLFSEVSQASVAAEARGDA